MTPVRNCGPSGEGLAAAYLEKKGYHILQRNYRFEHGEIDIVAEDNGTLVFIEVKARRSGRFGTAIEAVSATKQRHLRKAADGYIFQHHIDDQSCRFDVIAIEYAPGSAEPNLCHLENAF